MALIWRNIPKPARIAEVEAFIAQISAVRKNASAGNRVEAYMDGRIDPIGSHHQKSVIMRSPATGNRTVAYLGGGRPLPCTQQAAAALS